MHIYAFIVPHMHKMYLNTFLAYICILIYEDTTVLDNCTHKFAYMSLVMDTRVLFLQLVRLQGNTQDT